MRITLVDVPEILLAPVTEALRDHHVEVFAGDVRNLEECRSLAGSDVIVHSPVVSDDPERAIGTASAGVWNLLTAARPSRYILLSSMRLFDAYGPGWHITELWAPRPTTEFPVLLPWLAECAAREILREIEGTGVALRLDTVAAKQPADGDARATWLHPDDAAAAITTAIHATFPVRWNELHIVRGDNASRYPIGKASAEPFGFRPQHLVNDSAASAPAPSLPARQPAVEDLAPAKRVLLLGAGGPLGAVTTEMLQDDVHLVVSDRLPLADLQAVPAQSEGAPRPQGRIEPPHREHTVDVTDYDAVFAAMQGVDTVVNCTVLRHDPAQAFRVNTLGAYNIARAAAERGIRRIVQTGPAQVLGLYPSGYEWDVRTPENAPARPGADLYFVSKFLGNEIMRIFAETHGIACPCLHFIDFAPLDPALRDAVFHPFTVSWPDAGRAMRAAVHVTKMHPPFRVANIMALPEVNRYDVSASREWLGWQPEDDISYRWDRRMAQRA